MTQNNPERMAGARPGQPASPETTSAAPPGGRPSSGTADGGTSTGTGAGQNSLVPTLSLPKGGGAIRGIGEKFSTNPVTGTGSLSVPIATSGRAGFELGLSLHYDSGAQNGPHGLGWQYSTPSITRKTDKGLPRYLDEDESDVFLLSGAEDLVPVRVTDGVGTAIEVTPHGAYRVRRYQPRTEGSFARIERWTHDDSGDSHWQVTTRDNLLNVYGRSTSARIADPDHPDRVFSWLLEETRDDRGNVARYTYKPEDAKGVDPGAASESNRFEQRSDGSFEFRATAQRYAKRIQCGNRLPILDRDAPAPTADDAYLFEIVFDYGEHDEAAPAPAEVKPWPVRQDPFSSYRATFEVRTYRLCRRVLTFHRFAELGEAPCLVRSTDFTYDEGPAFTYLAAVTQAGYQRISETGAYERATLPPLDLRYARPIVHDELQTIDRESLAGIPAGVEGTSAQWVDLDGEGIPGVLIPTERAWLYKANLGGGQLALPSALRSIPSPAELGDGVQQLTDLGSDGRLDLVQYAPPLSGYFERTPEGDWAPFVALQRLPNLDWNDPNLRFLDVDGDGLPDVLITEHEAFVWYRSRGKQGFEPAVFMTKPMDERQGAAVVFADVTETIQLADMSGDGMVDIVRVRNSEVCYWPNLGYGRFGRKVTLSGGPWFDDPDRFDPKRVRFADIEGSGTSDLLYLGRKGVRLYFNQAGNAISSATPIESLPPVDSLSHLSVVDLLGQGTACLVWSSPVPGHQTHPLLYIDLMGGKKPHVLESVVNNLGAETRVAYAPSTKFYLQDKADGRPWLTRLSFPVHVIERTEHVDHVAKTKLVTTFAYHHGFYDGYEREFRGFACVEQWDAESFSGERGKGLFSDVAFDADPSENQLDVPPVRTVTWFHTGAWLERERLELALAKEYYGQDPDAPLLPDTRLPEGLSVQEEREAARALRGQILRQEVYAEDGKPESIHPYSVSERDHEVRLLQHAEGTSHAVFFVHPRHTINLHYERNPTDPRMQHDIVLAVDDVGNVTQAAAIGYPRRVHEQPEQARLWISLTESSFANITTGGHRLGVPLEKQTYELTGLVAPPAGVLSFKELRSAANSAKVLSYEQQPTGGLEKRLIEHARSRYYDSENIPNPLPFGQADARAILYESYRLALTVGLIEQVLNSDVERVTDAILTEGGYVHLGADPNWWAPSGRAVPTPAKFFFPTEFIDPFGNIATAGYDGYALLIERVEDAVHNVARAQNEYRVLGPAMIVDPNDNRSAVRFDALGMVVATAVMGKEGLSEGDTLDDPTTTIEYDLFRWKNSDGKLANFVHTRAREQHGPGNTRWQKSYSYADGSGREVMKKVQAEPGPAPQRDASGALVHDDQGKLVLADTNPRWVGTGRTVFDNKGNPVKQYEPFFTSTFEYEDEAELVEWGVTPILRYDPIGRLIRTDLPNGTFTKAIFDPWKEMHFDPNDTVLESAWYQARKGLNPTSDPEGRAAKLAAEHANTPAVMHLDTLGRAVRAIEDNGLAGQYTTTTTFDIEGNPLAITDARGVVAMQHRFGTGKQKLWQNSCDAGERWMLTDAGAAVLRGWDGRGFTRRLVYDQTRRATHLYVQPADGAEFLAERMVYGEALGNAAAVGNHRGRVYQQYDGAGVVTSVAYDFKGNLLASERGLAKQYHAQVDWKPIEGIAVPDAAASPLTELLEGEAFGAQIAYDALNRPTSQITPDNSETLPVYNEANLLDRVLIRLRGAPNTTTFVDDIDYDAKGQRMQIDYGTPPLDVPGVVGSVTTAYTYDPLTFRLTRLKTTRASDGVVLQNLAYTYDPVGNITEINDSAQQKVFFANDVVLPKMAYVYDAIYRLIQATGRELAGGVADVQRDENDIPVVNLPHQNDAQAVRNYAESYAYDQVGNILQMVHDSGAAPTSWTQRYNIATASNRLLGTSVPGDQAGQFSASYGYDADGNMTSMPHLSTVTWNHRDEIASADMGGGGMVYFTYDAAGQRVRKVWEHSGIVEERTYLDNGYEVYRRRATNATALDLERQTLHVMDGVRRIALVETKTIDTSVPAFQPATVMRFQLGNHLGSAVLEVDGEGKVISYEEYHPYGTTAYWAGAGAAEVSLKRYRYTGKERDEETGLYYQGARYYAPWLGRWTRADPAGMRGGIDLYAFVAGNPVKLVDPSGREPTTTYLGSSREARYVARLQSTWGGNQYWSESGSNGVGWYVQTEGSRILPHREAPPAKTGDAPENADAAPDKKEQPPLTITLRIDVPGDPHLDYSPFRTDDIAHEDNILVKSPWYDNIKHNPDLDLGHAFVVFNDPDKGTLVLGWYPSAAPGDLGEAKAGVPGSLHDDSAHIYDYSATYPVNRVQLDAGVARALSYAPMAQKHYPHMYQMPKWGEGKACIDFTTDVLSAAGIPLPPSEVQNTSHNGVTVSGLAPGAVAHALYRADVGDYVFPHGGTMETGLNGPKITEEQFDRWGGKRAP